MTICEFPYYCPPMTGDPLTCDLGSGAIESNDCRNRDLRTPRSQTLYFPGLETDGFVSVNPWIEIEQLRNTVAKNVRPDNTVMILSCPSVRTVRLGITVPLVRGPTELNQ